jgi:hypothetical protein
MALKRVWIASPNYSSRGGSGVRLIVIHTAEGARTFRELGNFFASPSAQVSSHVGIDDTRGTIGEYVKRPNKAWCQANANPFSVCVELCGFAAWTPAQWEQHPAMLDNCARWIAEESRHYGIPIVKLSAGQAEAGKAGVVGHADLGWAGNDHWDPGGNFPWNKVIRAAQTGGPVYGPEAPPAAAVLGALPFITESEADVPDYVINDVANGSRKFAVYASGLVRRMPGPEFQYVRDTLDVPVVEMNNREEGDRYYQYDQALRGQVKERE